MVEEPVFGISLKTSLPLFSLEMSLRATMSAYVKDSSDAALGALKMDSLGKCIKSILGRGEGYLLAAWRAQADPTSPFRPFAAICTCRQKIYKIRPPKAVSDHLAAKGGDPPDLPIPGGGGGGWTGPRDD